MDGGIQIGQTLRDARKRLALDIATLEQRTHIRTRYLRALEDEDWDALPAEAYTRAFLRTYAEALGLDAEALAEELRLRQGGSVGGAEALISPPTGDERPPSRWVVVALAVGIAVLLAILAFAGRDDGEEGTGTTRGSQSAEQRGEGRPRRPKSGPARASLSLVPLTSARVCVVSGGKALIVRQILSVGNREQFPEARRFLVDLEFGEVRLRTLDERTRLRADSAGEPLSVVVRPGQIRRVPYSGDSCP